MPVQIEPIHRTKINLYCYILVRCLAFSGWGFCAEVLRGIEIVRVCDWFIGDNKSEAIVCQISRTDCEMVG